jgi:nitrile hydratase subunit beta
MPPVSRPHDLGGAVGFGPVTPEADEPVFHADWERHAFALLLGAHAGLMTSHDFRFGIERMDPAHYLWSSYYEHWLWTVEMALLEKGVVSAAEIEERTRHHLEHPDAALPDRWDPELTARTTARLRSGVPTMVDVDTPPRFAVGDEVVARSSRTTGHTRLPRYLHHKRGVVERVHPASHLPDTAAVGRGQDPEHVYTVGFDGAEVWGEGAEPRTRVCADLWERYLDAG